MYDVAVPARNSLLPKLLDREKEIGQRDALIASLRRELAEQHDQMQAEIDALRKELGGHADNEFIRKCRAILRITPTRARILKVLMVRAEVSRQALALVTSSASVAAQVIDVHICALRKALEPHGANIKTIWGFGYGMDETDKRIVRVLLGVSP